MKPVKLTNAILDKLKPSDIIYAEFAEGGAMGSCATARIFTIEKGKLIFYLISAFDGETEEKVWGRAYEYLRKLTERGKLDEAYAGFGNRAWKQPDVQFGRDDDSVSFTYEEKGQKYQIPTSVAGVYAHLVAKFANRELSLEDLEKHFGQVRTNLEPEETDFYHLYLEQCKRMDTGADWFDLTIMDYLGAIAYIQHLNGMKYILNQEDLSNCRGALQKYRLKYLVEKIGWNKLNKFFADFASSEETTLFKNLSKLIGEPINKLFAKVEIIKSNFDEINIANEHNIASLFAYRPVLVDFSGEANTKIIAKIQALSPSSLRADAGSVAFFLANYLLHEDKWPLTDVLPAAIYVVRNIPLDDFNLTHTDQLLWVAGEIINDAWKFLAEDEDKQEKYRDLVYETYWPRIGSLWPIVNYNQFKFKDPVADKMFNDILGFVICLDDLTDRNPGFREYLGNYTPKKRYAHEMVRRKAFTESLDGLSAREEFDRIMAFESDIAWFYLTYPKGIEEAKILLDEIFKKKNNKFTGIGKFATLENLVITPNAIGVGEYILDYLDKHFEDLVEAVYEAQGKDMGLDYDPESVLEDLFIAMSQGVSEENEFPALKRISEKLIKRGANEAKIKSALSYARKHRRIILFQRSALMAIL